MTVKRTRVIEDLEGFRREGNNVQGYGNVWVCAWENGALDREKCSRQYVRKDAAIRHRQSHEELERRTKLLRDQEKQPSYTDGGDALRAMADELEKGIINLPDLINKLRAAAMGLDFLHAEIKGSDLRMLNKKGKAWDSLVAALPSIPEVLELLRERTSQELKAEEKSGVLDGIVAG